MGSGVNLGAYLDRIGHAGSIAPNLATLEALHLAHPAAIAFENLDLLMSQVTRLDMPSLNQKLLLDKRGGNGFEHNLLFLAVLHELEYSARGHWVHPLSGEPAGSLAQGAHMLLSVEIGGTTYLCDVGFGAQTPTAPLKLRSEVEQETPNEPFRLIGEGPAYVLESKAGEDWRPLYRFDVSDTELADFDAVNRYVATHPVSPTGHSLLAARAEKGTRHILRNTELISRTAGGGSEITLLESLPELKGALSTVFGIQLPPSDKLDPVLERVLAQAGTRAP